MAVDYDVSQNEMQTVIQIDVGVRHILVLDTFLLLPTCHLEPYDIYYVIWIDAD